MRRVGVAALTLGALVGLAVLLAREPAHEREPGTPPAAPAGRRGSEATAGAGVGGGAAVAAPSAGRAPSEGAGPAAGEPPSPLEAPKTYRVVDEDGRPVAGARVLVHSDFACEGPPLLELSSDADGRFVTVIGAGETLVIRAPGFAHAQVTDPKPLPSWIVLREGFRVSGWVVDGSQAPVVGARVTLEDRSPTGAECVTDGAGRFAFDGLRGGAGSVCLRVTRGEGESRLLYASVGDEEATLVWWKPWALHGVVHGLAGDLAADAELWVTGTEARCLSSDDGSFALSGEEPGEIRIVAERKLGEALLSGSVRLRVAEGETREGLRILLDRESPAPRGAPRSYARLRVIDPNALPVLGASVARHDAVLDGGRVATSATGVARLAFALPAGSSVELTVLPPQGSRRAVGLIPTPVTLTTGAEDRPPEKLVRLEKGVAVTFVFRGPAGESLPEDGWVRAALTGGRNRWIGPPDPCDEDRTTIWAAAGETFVLKLGASGFVEEERNPWTAPTADAEIEVRIGRGGGVAGRVVHADGSPVNESGAAVSVYRGPFDAGDGSEGSAPCGIVTTDAGGGFLLRGISPGPVRLTATDLPQAGLGTTIDLDVREGDTRDIGDLRLAPHPVLRGIVLDSAGRPIGGASIHARMAGIAERPTSSRSDGTFRARLSAGPPMGTAYVLVSKRTYGMVCVPLAPGPLPDSLRVVLPPEGTVRAHVAPESHNLLTRVSISTDGSHWWTHGELEHRDEGTGKTLWDLAELPPGPLRIRAEAGPAMDEKEVLVVAGQTTEVVLEPRPAKR